MPRQRLKNPIDDPPPASSLLSSSSSSSSSSSEGVEETQTNPTLIAKPIATKPMMEISSSKKARSKPLASPIKACSTKRAPDSEQQQQQTRKEAKRAKRKTDEEETSSAAAAASLEEVKNNGEDTKKQLFQRLFTDDDEIAVLKGILDYSAKKGTDPFADTNEFHAFVKKTMHTDVSKAQLMYKIRRLKKRFGNKARKAKNGEDRTFSKPHEQKIYDLSKKIWGNESGKPESSAPKLNGNGKGNSEALDAVKVEELLSSPAEKVDVGEPTKVDKNSSKRHVTLFDKRFGVRGLEEEVLKHGLDMIEGEKKAALEEKWRKFQVAELELFLQRNELMKEHAKLLLEFYKSKDE